MAELRVISSSTVLIVILLTSLSYTTVESGPIAGAACEAACVTVFIACVAGAPWLTAACFPACTACTQACAPVFLLPTP